MNKIKSAILCSFITIITIIVLTLDFLSQTSYANPTTNYQVYLDGEKIGLIASKDELYDLINKEQQEIKKEYNVDKVYPPKGFEIIEEASYNDELNTTEEIYEALTSRKEFTIKGYMVTIKTDDETEPVYLYVTDDKIFEEAVQKIVETFIGEERFKEYQTHTQNEISETGYIIDNMYFENDISVKETYISVDETIYTDADDLAKYLLFGNTDKYKEYKVVQGDTIESIAFNNELNSTELVMVNDDLKDEDSLLAIGQVLNVAPINPVLTLIYEETVVEDNEIYYGTTYEEDSSQYVGYKKVKSAGQNGISRVTSLVQFTNGTKNDGAVTIGEPEIIKSAVNEVVIKGTKKKASSSYKINYLETGDTWGWPTNSGYVITSRYQWRNLWGYQELHDGLDISGTGYGSPIYASLDGTVVSAQYGGMMGSSAGCNVVIAHANGYYTVYAHLKSACYKRGNGRDDVGCHKCKMIVSVGQTVKRGQVIGYMGRTGTATGVHLHFGLFNGVPYQSGSRPYYNSINPLKLWK